MTAFVRLVALVVVACAGCTHQLSVATPSDRDLAAYRTWAWLPAAARPADAMASEPDPKLEAKLEALLVEGLSTRGYTQVEAADAPDLLVAFEISVTAHQQLRSHGHAQESLNSSWGRGGQSYLLDRPSQVQRVPYEDAHLTVGIRDARDHEMVWFADQHRQVQGDFDAYLEDTLEALLAELPERPADS